MDITCTKCKRQFRIDAAKIAPDRPTVLTCPKCQTRITVNPASPPPAKGAAQKVALNEVDTGAYNPADRPFDFVEEEGKTALICEPDPRLRRVVTSCLAGLEYQITEADNARDALKRMRYHAYDLLVVNEDFDAENPDANGVLIYLERLGMAVRRGMYVVMVSARHRTMDYMTAFLKSVNLIVNANNIEDFGKILGRGLTEHLTFYRLFREKLKEAGRA
jgi:predicted Zn finger-like uncharacterized protein